MEPEPSVIELLCCGTTGQQQSRQQTLTQEIETLLFAKVYSWTVLALLRKTSSFQSRTGLTHQSRFSTN